MSEHAAGRGVGTRTMLIAALVLCVGWLAIQNAVLLVLAPWPGAAAMMAVVRVLARAAWVVAQQLWPVLAVSAGASAFAIWLVLGPARSRGREVRDGHARS